MDDPDRLNQSVSADVAKTKSKGGRGNESAPSLGVWNTFYRNVSTVGRIPKAVRWNLAMQVLTQHTSPSLKKLIKTFSIRSVRHEDWACYRRFLFMQTGDQKLRFSLVKKAVR